ncbi:hypothetical protein BDV96DRAFT_590539 [Lophiotrema nucula]|uniref:Uncharacterized protein n=1 Tax=Lophiotrema nucula TaxID=690887 RepID=A0A6A5YIM3_9PLEO|nr:hypothetical protein BDV96DRAFT_590539 [Lophiotrema nucula]
MSKEYEGQDLNDISARAERDLNSERAVKGSDGTKGASDPALDSGIDASVQDTFPGSEVTYGSAASGQGDNREIPLSEGGGTNPVTGQLYKARDFEGGAGGPEGDARQYAEDHGGEDDVRGNVRQGGETVRPAGSMPGNLKK